MKTAKYLFLNTLLIAALSSCSTNSRIVRADELSGEDFIDPNIEASAVPVQATTTTTKSTPAAKPQVKPSRKHSHHPSESAPAKSATASTLAGEWTIIKVGGVSIIQDEDMPYIIFSEKEGRFYCFDGCNTINGQYKVNTDKSITFSQVLQTMKACPDINYQNDIARVVNGSKPVKTKVEKVNNESYITLIYDGQDALVLRRHNMESFSGEWGIVNINGEAIDGDELNVFFDIPELTVHGNTGCNFFNGVIIVDPNVSSSISFAQMAVTMRACQNAELERQMLVALEEVCTYKIQDENTLLLLDSDGKTIITLKRMTD